VWIEPIKRTDGVHTYYVHDGQSSQKIQILKEYRFGRMQLKKAIWDKKYLKMDCCKAFCMGDIA
jgi:hypothetical protein